MELAPQEERIYRLRCVEGWSMVIPWVGYSLSKLIDKVEPLGNAKYVEFVTLADAIARAALPPAEIPLGLVTAVAGGPFFILLLARRLRS